MDEEKKVCESCSVEPCTCAAAAPAAEEATTEAPAATE